MCKVLWERVKHYLVKPEDMGSQKSLPDFLREKAQLHTSKYFIFIHAFYIM